MTETHSVYIRKDAGRLVLWTKYFGVDSPAGPRMDRGGKFPDIKFTHLKMDEAMDDADKLEQYLASVEIGKRSKKKSR